jgi:large subunit ribosomal protein L4
VATLKKYNLEGNVIGDVEIDERIANAEANGQMVKDYIVAIRANMRQWSANTKTRSEVSHSTKKPHPQKGGGRSRQGMLSAPQYKGGGRVHSPRPKFDQHVRINKKERQAAIRALFGDKIRSNNVIVIDDNTMESPRTKAIASFLKNTEISKRVLFLGEGHYADIDMGDDMVQQISISSTKHDNFIMSIRNVPKVEFSLLKNVSGYDLMIAHKIVLTESALQELNAWLS